jgi:hypothetical protein
MRARDDCHGRPYPSSRAGILFRQTKSSNGDDETTSSLSYARTTCRRKMHPRNRLCDENRGVWLRSPRYDTEHTHGTGCTLSSAIASALALGETTGTARYRISKARRGAIYPLTRAVSPRRTDGWHLRSPVKDRVLGRRRNFLLGFSTIPPWP